MARRSIGVASKKCRQISKGKRIRTKTARKKCMARYLSGGKRKKKRKKRRSKKKR